MGEMTEAQRTALAHHCRLAGETVHERFISLLTGGYSLVLTVNTGYE